MTISALNATSRTKDFGGPRFRVAAAGTTTLRARGSAPLRPLVLSGALSIVTLAGSLTATGQVTLDGRFGPAGPLTGPNYTIPATVGRTVGNNLFHSFGQFNLATGESADFTGPANIRNVISRVTGGSATAIDGTINCDIAGANFFFINPFGVIFGPNAQVNVSGSLVVSTADYVKLADGGRFDARNPAADVLTAAPVSAFGFLGPTAAAIQLNGPPPNAMTAPQSQLPEGQTIALIGGDIRISNKQLTAPAGRIALVSVAAAGEVAFDADDPTSPLDTSAFAKLGNIDLTDSTMLDVSGTGGGKIAIQADTVTIENQSNIYALTYDVGNGLGVDIHARHSINLLQSSISAMSFGAGNSGDIKLAAPVIRCDGQGGGANIGTDTAATGNAGHITITANSLDLVNGGGIAAGTSGSGRGGDVNIVAHRVTVDGQAAGTEMISSITFADGQAGSITIKTDVLTLDHSGSINSDTYGSTDGGRITIQTGTLSLKGVVTCISALSEGSGQGGAIDITANSVLLDGKDKGPGFMGILALASVTGNGGDILLKTDSLDVRNGAQISAATLNNVVCTGDAGNIDLRVTDLRVSSHGAITSAADGSGKAGSVTIHADHSILIKNHGVVSVFSANNDAGNITLTAPSLIYLLDSQVSAHAQGNGGNIYIDPVLAIFNDSQLVASAIQGHGGNIAIRANYFLESASRFDVSSEFGVQGNLTITAPDANLSGSLLTLDATLLDAAAQLQPQCAVRLPGGASSLISVGRGGVPIEPDRLLPAFQLPNDKP